MKRAVLVTGVSSGIGLSSARALLSTGYRVFGSVRSAEDAQRLQRELGPDFMPLQFDVTHAADRERAIAAIAQQLGATRLAALVNNAGIAVAGPFLHVPLEQLRYQMEVNFFAAAALCQLCAPLLGTDPSRTGPPGRIVQISSVSGKFAYPYMAPYAASKHALEALSESLRVELMPYGIRVVVIGPGAIRTPIWGKTSFEAYSQTPYASSLALMAAAVNQLSSSGLAPELIGGLVAEVVSCDHPYERYAPVPGNSFSQILAKWIPRRWMDRIMAKRLGLDRSFPG